MKKKMMSLALALVMCLSLCVPAFAGDWGGGGRSDCTEGHTPPAGYEYYNTVTGNTDLEFYALTTGPGLAALSIPAFGTIITVSAAVLNAIYLWNPGDRGRGDYVKITFYDRKTSGFWYHTLFYGTDTKGNKVYLGCEVDREWISNR